MVLVRNHDDLLERRHGLGFQSRSELWHDLGHHLVVVLRLEGLGGDDGLHADFVQAELELGRLVGRVYVDLRRDTKDGT